MALAEKLKINEIFYSIQGESSLVGWPTIFIRTSGCHLRCTYCDTQYAYYDGEKMSLEDILNKVANIPCKRVCLTGGEPLLQKPSYLLLKTLCDRGYFVSLETSGDIFCNEVDSRVKKIIDIKTPDSGEPNTFNLDNLTLSEHEVEFKFVICSEADFIWAENFIRKNNMGIKFNILYSPSYKKISEKWLAEKILSENSPVRLQIQLHKSIWPDKEQGV